MIAAFRPSRRKHKAIKGKHSRTSSKASLSYTSTADKSRTDEPLHDHDGSKRVVTVTFDLKRNQEIANENDTVIENEQDLWFTTADCKKSRDEQTRIVEETHGEAVADPFSFESVVTRAYKACCEAECDTLEVLTPFDAMHLTKSMDEKVLGMDSFLTSMADNRAERQRALYSAVLQAQRYYGKDSEVVSKEAERFSLAAKLFARVMATAVAGDVEVENQERRLSAF
jgi:hypothetical protein